MQRVRLRYTKDGRTRFVSARDVAGVWARALRRADLPIAYSEGFTPHPKVSFPDALPVGVASTGEYAELTFAAPVDPDRHLPDLDRALPEGMRIVHHRTVADGEPKLARLLQSTLWEVFYPEQDADEAARTAARLEALASRVLGAESAIVTRTKPNDHGGEDTRAVDLRPVILDMHTTLRAGPGDAGPHEPAPTLRAILRNDGPSVRPGDLHDILEAHASPGDPPLPTPRLLRRVVQGRAVAGGLAEALSGEHVPLAGEVAPSRKREDRDRRDEGDEGRRGPQSHAHAHAQPV